MARFYGNNNRVYLASSSTATYSFAVTRLFKLDKTCTDFGTEDGDKLCTCAELQFKVQTMSRGTEQLLLAWNMTTDGNNEV